MKPDQNKINYFLERGFLISPDLLEGAFDNSNLLNNLQKNVETNEKPMVINQDLFNVVSNKTKLNINWIDFEKSKSFSEKGRDTKIYNTFLDILNYNISDEKKQEVKQIIEEIREAPEKVVIEREKEISDNNILILKNYQEVNKKREVQDFVSYFKRREP